MTNDVADPHSSWPDRTPLSDADGRLLLVFTKSESVGSQTPWVDGVWRPTGISPDEAVRTALDAFAGWLLSTSDPDLVAGLMAAGSIERRHAHAMSHDLAVIPPRPLDPGVELKPLTPDLIGEQADRLADLYRLAYPGHHPDAFYGDRAAALDHLHQIAAGHVLGPLLPESRAALLRATMVGACFVVDRGGAPPDGGPWILDVFRDPQLRVPGIGSALLVAVLAAARGHDRPGISLAVSDANNRARRLYTRLGFTDHGPSWTLRLPAAPGPLSRDLSAGSSTRRSPV
ncbi:MAG: GNAT family N-acetyltransferase [Nocardioidaceae bacterium]